MRPYEGDESSAADCAPVFVIGPARSGTTLLQAMLGAHSSIAALPEMHFWFRVVNLADHWGDLSEPAGVRSALEELITLPGGLLDDAGFELERLMASLPPRRTTYRDLLDVVGRDLCQRTGKRRWSEKTPWQTADQIWRLFPEARVIQLIREPRHTVGSTVRAPFNDLPAWRLAQNWHRYTLANIEWGAARGPEYYLPVRYEDLVRVPRVTLGRVCHFLGENFESSMLSRGEEATGLFTGPLFWQAAATGPIRTAPPPARLRPSERALVAVNIRGTAGALGYEEPRRRTVLAGRALWPTTLPRRLHDAVRRWRQTPLSPAQRHRAVRRYTEERVAAALGASAPVGVGAGTVPADGLDRHPVGAEDLQVQRARSAPRLRLVRRRGSRAHPAAPAAP